MDTHCPHCGTSLKVRPEWAGKKASCNVCNGRFEIPAVPPTLPVHPPEAPQWAAGNGTATAVRQAAECLNGDAHRHNGEAHQHNGEAQQTTDRVRKTELKRLIVAAASGDTGAAKRLIGPFVAPEEKLLMHGISAKFGLIPTYDFYFLTDRRIGDMEITPFTGNLNVEVAYIHKIDAFVLSQPAFPIMLRLILAGLYLFLPFMLFGMAAGIGSDMGLPGVLAIFFGLAAAAGMVWLVAVAVNPAIKRAFLRFKKSGVWLKLHGSPLGVLIFADRNKFDVLTLLTRAMSDVKRQLDRIAA